jgi:hypothetical protein
MRGADAMFFKKPSMSGFLIEGAHRVEPLLLNREAVKKVGFYLFQWLPNLPGRRMTENN